MVERALSAGEHGVVVGHHDAAVAIVREEVAVDRTDAGHHPVGRELADDLFLREAGARSQHELTVLHEAALVAQLVDVLAGRPLFRVAPLPDRVGPGLVERHPVAFEHLGEVGPHRVEVDFGLLLVARDLDVPLLDQRQDVAFPDRVADGGSEVAEHATHLRADLVLHLHRFHDEEDLPGSDLLAGFRLVTEDGALHWGAHGGESVRDRRLFDRRGRRGRHADRRLARFAVIQYGERVDGVDLDACQAALRARGTALGGGVPERGRGLDEFGQVLVDEAGVDVPRLGLVPHEKSAQEGSVRFDALDPKVAERAGGSGQGGAMVRLRHAADDLGQQGVETGIRLVAGVAEGVRAQSGSAGGLEGG